MSTTREDGCLLDIFLLNRKAAEHKYDSSIWISAKFLFVNFCLCRWAINGRFLTIYTANHQFDPIQLQTDIWLLADWLCHVAEVPSGFSDNVNMPGNLILQQRQKKSRSEIMLSYWIKLIMTNYSIRYCKMLKITIMWYSQWSTLPPVHKIAVYWMHKVSMLVLTEAWQGRWNSFCMLWQTWA